MDLVSSVLCSQGNFCRFMGGNSTKATSGINGAGTQTQQELGIPDNAKIFFEDTKKSVSVDSHSTFLHLWSFSVSWLPVSWLV